MKQRTKSLDKQSGVFLTEFAVVASVMALFMVFISDMVSKQTIQGHLQRLSYSGVNVIKERTQLYELEFDEKNSPNQAQDLYEVLSASMKRTMSGFDNKKFGMYLEQLQLVENENNEDVPALKQEHSKGMQCRPATGQSLTELDNSLFVETSWGRRATLYQVTLCYEGDNWYGDLVDETFTTVRASSIMLGR